MLELLKDIGIFFLRLFGLYKSSIQGEKAIDVKIGDNIDKMEVIDDKKYNADSLADDINKDK